MGWAMAGAAEPPVNANVRFAALPAREQTVRFRPIREPSNRGAPALAGQTCNPPLPRANRRQEYHRRRSLSALPVR